MCAFVVLGLVFLYQAKTLAWGTSLKWLILCQVGPKTTTQSITLLPVSDISGCVYFDRMASHHCTWQPRRIVWTLSSTFLRMVLVQTLQLRYYCKYWSTHVTYGRYS